MSACIDCNNSLRKDGLRCHLCNLKSRTKVIPEDFKGYIATHSQEDAAGRYEVSVATIQKWIKRLGIAYKPPLRPVPQWFAEEAPGLYRSQVKLRAKVGDRVLDRWLRETGVQCRPTPVKVFGRKTWKPARQEVAIRSQADAAAEYLRRYGPVYRCNDRGAATSSGTFWRRGSAILTDAEIVERARYNRWNPDAWKQLAVAA